MPPQDQEKVIRLRMRVPYELTLQFHQHYVVTIELLDELRRPVIGEFLKLLLQVDNGHLLLQQSACKTGGCAEWHTSGMITGVREAHLLEAANLLLDARRTLDTMIDLPLALQPVSLEEVNLINTLMMAAYGPVGGWKIGAASPDAVPGFAPMPKAWIYPSGSVLSAASHRYRGLEAEIAFLLGTDLPVRETHYTREEVLAAVASCHPVIEELESGLTDPVAAMKLSKDADLQMHGGLIYGPAYADWRNVDFSREKVTLVVDGVVRVERTGSNTSGDLVRLLPYLANEGSVQTGGLKAGQWITTGSWTGNVQTVSGVSVDALFSTVGGVELQFA
jgi:2-keto-4-pentenoate hydratase